MFVYLSIFENINFDIAAAAEIIAVDVHDNKDVDKNDGEDIRQTKVKMIPMIKRWACVARMSTPIACD